MGWVGEGVEALAVREAGYGLVFGRGRPVRVSGMVMGVGVIVSGEGGVGRPLGLNFGGF